MFGFLWTIFGSAVPPLVVTSILYVLTLSFLEKKGKNPFEVSRFFLKSALGISTISILFITMYPTGYNYGDARMLNVEPLKGMYNLLLYSTDPNVTISNLGLNILLFMPFGFFLFLCLRKKASLFKVTFYGMCLSFTVELFQYIFPIGRSTDVDDLILNTGGTLIGASLAKILNAMLSSSTKEKLGKKLNLLMK
ncbi:VanZ family protein [Priestia endophytica]|uniref:VanZ family protein n=1 Tax=Priestia endophytica TaxID=135735 RepID=UPI0020407670|nr:VanZ family protein [Priestia endophytica]MCM3537032.1 VanZ family protein [Priestia endophytica]